MPFSRHMCPVAKRLVLRLSAPTQGNPVSYLITASVRTFYTNSSFYPNGAADFNHRVFDQSYCRIKWRFKNLACFFIPNNQTAGWTMLGFMNDLVTFFLGFGRLYQIPNSTVGIAKTSESAIFFIISKYHSWPYIFFGIFQ